MSNRSPCRMRASRLACTLLRTRISCSTKLSSCPGLPARHSQLAPHTCAAARPHTLCPPSTNPAAAHDTDIVTRNSLLSSLLGRLPSSCRPLTPLRAPTQRLPLQSPPLRSPPSSPSSPSPLHLSSPPLLPCTLCLLHSRSLSPPSSPQLPCTLFPLSRMRLRCRSSLRCDARPFRVFRGPELASTSSLANFHSMCWWKCETLLCVIET
jgi:hypothetical protein